MDKTRPKDQRKDGVENVRTCDHRNRLAELDLQDSAICNFRTEFWEIPYRTLLFGVFLRFYAVLRFL